MIMSNTTGCVCVCVCGIAFQMLQHTKTSSIEWSHTCSFGAWTKNSALCAGNADNKNNNHIDIKCDVCDGTLYKDCNRKMAASTNCEWFWLAPLFTRMMPLSPGIPFVHCALCMHRIILQHVWLSVGSAGILTRYTRCNCIPNASLFDVGWVCGFAVDAKYSTHESCSIACCTALGASKCLQRSSLDAKYQLCRFTAETKQLAWDISAEYSESDIWNSAS